jgi:hypothetical protein
MDLEAIRRRLDGASPGPWARHGCDVHAAGSVILRGLDAGSQAREQADRDAEFVAHARQDVAALLEALEAGAAPPPPPEASEQPDAEEPPRRRPRHAAS